LPGKNKKYLDINMSFSERVKTVRKQLDLTQNEFAKKLDVTAETVKNWEYGKNTPSLQTIGTIANTFGVSMNWLLVGGPSSIKNNSAFSVPYYTDISNSGLTADGNFDISPSMFNIRKESGIAVLYVKGNGMSPYINDGDGILVDLDEKSVRVETAYVIKWREAVLVKDIQLIAEGVKLISRNPVYEPIILAGDAVNEIQIIGRVLGGFYLF
jgi:transcriptional regulator with XRE-family HTH domain